MKNIIPRLLSKITRKPRSVVSFKLEKHIWVANLFRLWECIAGKEDGIHLQARSSATIKHGRLVVEYDFYTWEALFTHIEATIRGYFDYPFFNPYPHPAYRQAFVAFSILGLLISFNLPTHLLPLFGLSIAFDSVTNGETGGGGSGANVTVAHTCVSGTTLLVVGIAVNDSNQISHQTDAVAYNSVSLTQLEEANSSGDTRAELWYLLAPTTGSSKNVVVNYSYLNYLGIGVLSFTGTDTSAPTQYQGSNGTASSVSMSLTPSRSNSWMVDVISDESSPTTTRTLRWSNTNQSYQQGRGSTTGPVSTSTSMGYTGLSRWSYAQMVVAPPASNVTTNQTQLGKSRITATTTKTQLGKSRVTATTPKTQLGKSRVTATTQQTQLGKSRITATTPKTLLGRARVTISSLQAQLGKAAVRNTTSQAQLGKARLQQVVAKTLAGLSRITSSTAQTLTGKSRVTASTSQTQQGKGNIRNTTNQTQSGLSRVIHLATQTMLGVANIFNTTNQTQTGKARITQTTNQAQTGQARIQFVQNKTQLGKTRITATTTKTQLGKADIQKTTSQTLPGKSRITSTVPKTQLGESRITAATSQTQTGKGRVQKVSNQTQSGKAYIQTPQDYSRETIGTLPTDTSELSTVYNSTEVSDVATQDSVYVDVAGQLKYLLHQFKNAHVNNVDPIEVTWVGKTTRPCSDFPVKLQIYNFNTSSWEDVSSNSTAVAGTPFTLSGTISASTSDYYDANYYVCCRVYQEVS